MKTKHSGWMVVDADGVLVGKVWPKKQIAITMCAGCCRIVWRRWYRRGYRCVQVTWEV